MTFSVSYKEHGKELVDEIRAQGLEAEFADVLADFQAKRDAEATFHAEGGHYGASQATKEAMWAAQSKWATHVRRWEEFQNAQ